MAIPSTDPMENTPVVPKAVTDILGPITEKQFNALITVLANQIVSKIRISNDPWGNPSVRVK